MILENNINTLNNLSEYFYPLFYSCLSFVIIYITGYFITNLLNLNQNKKSFNFFLSILFGVISWVTIYSIFQTSGNTINLITLLILVILYYINKDKQKNISKFNFQYLIISLFLVSISCFVLYYFFMIKSNMAVFGDNHYYSIIAYNLNELKTETEQVNWTQPQFTNSYHYTEQWFTAIFSNLFNINTLHSYYFIYCPVFLVLIIFGALAIYESFCVKFNIYLGFLLSFLFIFIQIIDYPFNNSTILVNLFYVGYPLFNIKYIIVYAIFITTLLFIKNNNYKTAFYIILFTIPLYSTIIPSILTGLFVLFLYLFIIKTINRKQLFYNLIVVTIFFILYALFYFFQNKQASIPWNKEHWEQFYDSFYKISKLTIVLIVGIISFLFTYYYFIKKIQKSNYQNKFDVLINNKTKINGFLVFVISGILIVFIIFPVVNSITHDSFQLLSIFIIPIYTISLFVVILIIIRNKNIFFQFCITSLLLIYFLLLTIKNPSYSLNMYKHPYLETESDDIYYKKIKELISKDNNPRFAYYRKYDKEKAFYLKTYLFMPDSRIVHFQNNYMPLCLNPYEMPAEIDYRFGDKKTHAFYNYYLENKNNQDMGKITLDFLKKHKIKYVILENDYLCPEYIKPKIKVIYINSINKNTFLMIN